MAINSNADSSSNAGLGDSSSSGGAADVRNEEKTARALPDAASFAGVPAEHSAAGATPAEDCQGTPAAQQAPYAAPQDGNCSAPAPGTKDLFPCLHRKQSGHSMLVGSARPLCFVCVCACDQLL